VIKCFILYSSNGNRLFFHLKGLRSLVSDILNEHCGKTRNPNYAQNTYLPNGSQQDNNRCDRLIPKSVLCKKCNTKMTHCQAPFLLHISVLKYCWLHPSAKGGIRSRYLEQR